MNDKVRELLENAEQSDAIARNKWRIENREQLRKERKEKLKELMEKDKQQTAVEIFWNQLPEILPFTVDTATAVKLDEAYQQAKEMEKEKMIEFAQEVFRNRYNQIYQSLGNIADDIYNETFGGGEQ